MALEGIKGTFKDINTYVVSSILTVVHNDVPAQSIQNSIVFHL